MTCTTCRRGKRSFNTNNGKQLERKLGLKMALICRGKKWMTNVDPRGRAVRLSLKINIESDDIIAKMLPHWRMHCLHETFSFPYSFFCVRAENFCVLVAHFMELTGRTIVSKMDLSMPQRGSVMVSCWSMSWCFRFCQPHGGGEEGAANPLPSLGVKGRHICHGCLKNLYSNRIFNSAKLVHVWSFSENFSSNPLRLKKSFLF